VKAFISVDLEGMPYVVIPGHLSLKGSLYDEARKISTKVTVIVAEELNKNGFDDVVIADSHGPMVNLLKALRKLFNKGIIDSENRRYKLSNR